MLLLLLAVAAIIAYSNSFLVPFIYDDISSTRDNPHIRSLWPLSQALWAPPNTTAEGRPVVALSLALNYAMGGLDVWGYHAFNLAVHILAGVVLFGLVWRTLASRTPDALWIAFSIALLWELHPLSTEAVTYVIQRTELLASFFLLATLYCLARGASSRTNAWRWYTAGVVACALGMGCKEIMAGAPLIALLYDRTFFSDSWSTVWRERRLFHAGLVATWAVLAVLIAVAGHTQTIGFGFSEVGPLDYLKTQCGAILYYLRLSLWPSPLSLDYSDWPVAKAPVWTLPSVGVMLALGGLTMWALTRRSAIAFLGACFFIILAPSSSFVPIVTELVAERRMYLPLAALVTMIVAGGYFLVPPARRKFALAGVLIVAVVFGVLTFRRNVVYRSELAIWQDVIEKRPANARAHNNVGFALGREGKGNEAIAHFSRAISLKPDYPDALNNLAAMLDRNGRTDEAVPLYRKVVSLTPNHLDARFNLSLALHRLGNLDEAEQGYLEVLKRSPGYLNAHNNLAVILLNRGSTEEAIAHLEAALRVDPTFKEAINNLAAVRQANTR